MFFSRDLVSKHFGQNSSHESRAARRRQRRKLAAGVQSLEGRMLLSHAGIVHVRHPSPAVVAKLDHRHGHGKDDGLGHDAQDDRHRRGHGRDDTTQQTVTTASTGRNSKDDPAGHDAVDDHGLGAHGRDDTATHDANDDRGGQGKDDGSGHK
jgi:hypothetical protein